VIRGRHDWSPLAPTPSFRARDQIFYSESRVGFGGKAHGPGDQQPALPRPPSRPSTVFVSCKREAGKEETAVAYHMHGSRIRRRHHGAAFHAPSRLSLLPFPFSHALLFIIPASSGGMRMTRAATGAVYGSCARHGEDSKSAHVSSTNDSRIGATTEGWLIFVPKHSLGVAHRPHQCRWQWWEEAYDF
jgi:hypothetical protein